MTHGHMAASSIDSRFPVSSTLTRRGLVFPGATSPNYAANVGVTHLDLSLRNPAAVVELTIGRLEPVAKDAVSGNYARNFRGNSTLNNRPYWTEHLTSPDHLLHVLGRYFFSGGSPLQLDFHEPIEALVDAESSTDQVFGFELKRIDTSDEVECHVNAWYEVYF